MRVLVIDHQVLFREGLVDLINAEPDFKVCGQGGSMSEGVSLAVELNPDLVLIDYDLPDGTGAEATRIILAQKPDCKIVILSSDGAEQRLFNSIRSGVIGFLLKDVSIHKLITALRSVQDGEAAISRSMTAQIMKELAQPGPAEDEPLDALACLTQREQQVLRELMEGFANREISARLFIDENTVKHHVHSILSKLQQPNRHAAAQFARQRGFK